jgi:hypothetical protein
MIKENTFKISISPKVRIATHTHTHTHQERERERSLKTLQNLGNKRIKISIGD